MRKRDHVTYLVLLGVGAIEEHMARGRPGATPSARERNLPERSLQRGGRAGREGGLAR